MTNPFAYWNRHLDMVSAQFIAPYEAPRRNTTAGETAAPPTADPLDAPSASSPPRRMSTASSSSSSRRQNSLGSVRTRSLGFGAGVMFERSPAPPHDDDLLIVTVKVAPSRRKSVDGIDELPARPPARGFLRRMSTRLSSGSVDRGQVKAMKMPRRDYTRYFRRNADGVYMGTEPEREWSEEDLVREFGMYQDLPLRQVLAEGQTEWEIPRFM